MLIAFKLVVHVGMPVLILLAIGGKPGALFTVRASSRGFWLILLVVGVDQPRLHRPGQPQPEADRRPEAIAAHAGCRDCRRPSPGWRWRPGLCEEFLFRAVLQTRLAAVMKTEIGAAAIAALLFALAHVPGLYMRSARRGGRAFAEPAGGGRLCRGRAVADRPGPWRGLGAHPQPAAGGLLHALVDLLPGVPDFAHTWMLAGG